MRVLISWLGAWCYGWGQLLLSLGRPGRRLAGPWLRLSLALRPQATEAEAYLDYLRGVRLMERGEPEEAREPLRRAAERLPGDPAVAMDAAIAATVCGEYETSTRELDRLLRAHPRMHGERQLWFALAWSHLRLGHYQRALDLSREGTEQAGGSPQLLLVAHLARLALGQTLDQAALGALLRTRPNLLGHVLEFAQHLAGGGKRSAADELAPALPESLRACGMRLIAVSALHEGRGEVARWALGHLAVVPGEEVSCQVLRSELALHEGKLEEALLAAYQAAELGEGKHHAAEEQLGEVLLLAGNAEEAYPHFVEALARGSSSALAGGVVALRLLEENRLEDAQRVFRPQRSGGELGVAYAHSATGLILLRRERVEEAAELAGRAWEEYRQLPAWAGRPAVRRQLLAAIRQLVEGCLEEGAQGEVRERAELVREQVEAEWRRRFAAESESE